MNAKSSCGIALIVVFGCVLYCASVEAQGLDPKFPEDAKVLKFSKKLSPIGELGLVSTVIDVGVLEAGQAYRITLDLTTPFAEPTNFIKLVSSCGCASVSANKMFIATDEPTRFVINIKVPDASHSNQVSAGFGMYSDVKAKDYVGMVTVKGALAGNLRIDTSRNLFELTKKDVEVCRLPFVYSSPIDPEKLELSLSGSLRDIIGKIVISENGDKFIELLVAADSLDKSGLSGWVELVDGETGKSSRAELLFTTTLPVVISPTMLRFRPEETTEVGEAEYTKATVLLKIERSFLGENDSNLKGSLPVIECSMNGVALKRKVVELGGGVYKIVVRKPVPTESKPAKEREKIIWRIASGGRSLRIESLVSQ
jgi:hypothetical protein